MFLFTDKANLAQSNPLAVLWTQQGRELVSGVRIELSLVCHCGAPCGHHFIFAAQQGHFINFAN